MIITKSVAAILVNLLLTASFSTSAAAAAAAASGSGSSGGGGASASTKSKHGMKFDRAALTTMKRVILSQKKHKRGESNVNANVNANANTDSTAWKLSILSKSKQLVNDSDKKDSDTKNDTKDSNIERHSMSANPRRSLEDNGGNDDDEDDLFDEVEEEQMNAYQGSWYDYSSSNNANYANYANNANNNNNNNNNVNNNNYYNNSYGYDDNDMASNYYNASDPYYASSSVQSNSDNKYYYDNNQYYFSDNNVQLDFTQYSIKFHSCYAIKNFDIENFNGNNDGNDNNKEQDHNEEQPVWPYTTSQIVTYRLCEVDSCSESSWNGCNNVYGNYAVSLSDYINAHQDHVSEIITQFCSYCRYCTYVKNVLNVTCDHYGDCGSYNGLCYDDDGSQPADYTQFLECTEVDVVNADALDYYENGGGNNDGNGAGGAAAGDYYGYNGQYYQYGGAYGYEQQQQAYQSGYNNDNGNDGKRHRRRGRLLEDKKAYVKMYCDGSIKLGLFSDDTCTNYIGGADAIYETAGLDGVEDELNEDIFTSDCFSCTKKKSKYYIMDQQEYEYKQYGSDNGYQDDGDYTYEFCEEIYDESAKCNSRLGENYYSNDRTCNIVESIQRGLINEHGFLQYYQGGILDANPIVWMFILVILPACITLALVYLYNHHRGSIDGKDFDTSLVDSDDEDNAYSVRFSDDDPVVFT